MALVNLGLQVSGYTNFGLACVLWAIAAILAFWGVLPWLAGLRLKSVSATSEPPQRVGYADAAPSQGAHALEVEPDSWLSDAMWWAFLRTWDVPPGGMVSLNSGESENQRFAMLIIQEFPQLAFDEKLPIWGRRKDSFRWEPIPPDFWSHNHIDHILVMSADPQEDIKAIPDNPWEKPDTSGDWHHFKTSKAVIERLYPRPQ
jgi:hypothetical protein